MTEETLFSDALLLPHGQRAAFLAQACGNNHVLLKRMEVLLAAYHPGDNFLEPLVVANGQTRPYVAGSQSDEMVSGPLEKLGSWIGPYRLLEQIGEGGFGVVFMAEQNEPVRRKVALKIVKPGMDTRQVVVRFEAERQALAIMDHPNIAHVFDGGETASGRPYFVMELVRGIPITEFCDQNQISIHRRLELFVNICQAVQHAHQKGIIHRDLKPSNILVTLHDGTPVVKVIDFGIAKATGQQLTDKTLFTNFALFIGTPMYMSPEQAAHSGLDVDTRADIYALGVLLYELLTGTTPFDKQAMQKAPYDEIQRIIREEEPPRPSTQLTTLGKDTATICANRRSDSRQLSQMLRGELDWIVLKALEKDRNRRYETVSAFAADIQRYLRDEPVQACPPSLRYRMRKFVRRNKGRVIAASLVLLALVAGMVGTTWGLFEALQQKREARQQADIAQAVSDFLQNDLLLQSLTDLQSGDSDDRDPDIKVRTLLDRTAQRLDGQFIDQPLTEAAIRMTLAQTYSNLGVPAKAIVHADRSFELRQKILGPTDEATLHAKLMVAILCGKLERIEKAESYCREMLAVPTRQIRGFDLHIEAKILLAYAARDRAHLESAESIFQDVITDATGRFGSDYESIHEAKLGLAGVYYRLEKYDRAAALFSEDLAWRTDRYGPGHSRTQRCRQGLAECYLQLGKLDLAEPVLLHLVEVGQRLHPNHSYLLSAKGRLASLRKQQGAYDEAEALFREVLDAERATYGDGNGTVISTKVNLAAVLSRQNKIDSAIKLLIEAADAARANLGMANPITQDAICDLIICYENAKRHDLAKPLLQQFTEFWNKRSGPFGPKDRPRLATLGRWLLSKKRFVEAEDVLRAGLITCDKIRPAGWERIQARLLLAFALLNQDKAAEAEQLLSVAEDVLTNDPSRFPTAGRTSLIESCRQIAGFYTTAKMTDTATKWNQITDKLRSASNGV